MVNETKEQQVQAVKVFKLEMQKGKYNLCRQQQ